MDSDIELEPRVEGPLVEETSVDRPELSKIQAWNLYTSHALSTWNARTFEFAVILFTTASFPDTLLASSIRGLCNTLAALCLSPAIGSWIDRSPSRLRTLLLTITVNRLSVILGCLGWAVLIFTVSEPVTSETMQVVYIPEWISIQGLKSWLFAVVLVLGIFEKLSGIGNMISMERDWVPVLASRPRRDGQQVYDLTHLNANIRRIDLVCKLVSPLVISVVISSSSMLIGVSVVAGMSAVSWGFEVLCARRVCQISDGLRAPRGGSGRPTTNSERELSPTLQSTLLTAGQTTSRTCSKQWSQLVRYFSTDVWIPSLSLSLLHLSALSYSATFITFLLNSGFSLLVITVARAAGSLVEVSSTFVAPIGIHYLAFSKPVAERNEDQEQLLDGQEEITSRHHATGLARSGLWGITLQLGNLIPVVLAIWYLRDSPTPSYLDNSLTRFLRLATPTASRPFAAIIMFTFLSVSRLGLWVFDLTTQEITQTHVAPEHRSSFAGTEMAFVSLFELSQWILGAIISKPEDFRWIALISTGAVGVSTGMYAFWVRRQRGHLMHWERIGKGCYGPFLKR